MADRVPARSARSAVRLPPVSRRGAARPGLLAAHAAPRAGGRTPAWGIRIDDLAAEVDRLERLGVITARLAGCACTSGFFARAKRESRSPLRLRLPLFASI